MADDGLSTFHPLVREWFLGRYGSATPIQAAAWPRIAAGEHVLALAPTGGGKTLAAFLGALSRLFSGDFASGRCSVLYISPLKALGEDMRRNLEEPLAGIASLFARRGLGHPEIRVAVRSGDTSQAERRRIALRPPSILVTTPESLGLMLDSPVARNVLADVRLVIVDELHSLAGNKRGALLSCALGRLALLSGEFQRVALSATVAPSEVAAAFLGGRELLRGEEARGEQDRGEQTRGEEVRADPPSAEPGCGDPAHDEITRGGSPRARKEAAAYRRRPVTVVSPPTEKRIELKIEWPTAGASGNIAASGLPDASGAPAASDSAVADAAPRYEAVVPAILERLRSARGILVFTDSRRRSERLAFLLNQAAGETVAWAHHGSLSKEARRSVEERFKAGELGCVVATSSLELGIDIGHVDEVVLAGCPRSVSSALQRIGRAGHRVGEVSRALLLPFHGMDLLFAAATFRGVADRAVEELRPPSCPLDILVQVLLQLAVESPRTVDELYDIVLSFPPFERLSRGLFDSAVELLAGRYAGERVRELEPKAFLDRSSGLLVARDGARRLLYSSGGAIPDRGLYSLRLSGSRARIGELDEEFVWERRVGESFTLGAQTWKIVDIGDEAVEVVPSPPDPDIIPFWKGEAGFRSPGLSLRALELLDELGSAGLDGGVELLVASCGFSAEAAKACAGFVESQKAAGRGSPSLPGTRRLVLELHADPAARRDRLRLVLHTLRGRALNEALAIATAAAWEEELGLPIETVADDDWILLVAPSARGAEHDLRRMLFGLAAPGRLAELVRRRLEGSGLFGAQFRENAGRALLLPRGLPGARVPLWMTRLRAKRLFEAVRSYPDFPIVVESWRSCLVDLLDLEGAAELARDLAEGRVELSVLTTRNPTPFAREAVWRETGEFMYRGDTLEGRASSSVSSRVIEDALRSSRFRPALEPALVDDFERRIKRLLPGWGASDQIEFAEWVKERVAIPLDELPAMLAAASPELGSALEADPSCGGRVGRLRLPGAEAELLVHAERERELEDVPESRLAEWLRREALVQPGRLRSLFGFSPERLEALLDELSEEGTVVVGSLLSGSEEIFVVDAENLELLLRRSRAARRPRVEARPAADLLRFVAAVQSLPPHGIAAIGAAPSGLAAAGGAAVGSAYARPAAAPDRTAALAAAVGSAYARPAAAPDRAAALAAVLDRLSGAALSARAVESEVLPARLADYRPGDLDKLFSGGEWSWFGCGRETIALCRSLDLELFLGGGAVGPAGRESGDEPVSRLLEAGSPPEDFWAIKEKVRLDSRELAQALWSEAWSGLVASDSFASIREGLGNEFGAALPAAADLSAGESAAPFGSRRRLPRALRGLWRAGPPLAGRWFSLAFEEATSSEAAPDALDEEELAVERVRVLCRRYGLLCRPLLERELESLSWRSVFTAARRLELSGELLAGRFFEGIDGPQFMDASSLGVFRELEAGEAGAPKERAVWIGSTDPAAAAAYAPAERSGLLPPRIAANRICLSDGRVLAASRRSWRSLEFALPPNDPALGPILAAFRPLRERSFLPERRILVEEVNGETAARGAYAAAMEAAGFERDRDRLVLW